MERDNEKMEASEKKPTEKKPPAKKKSGKGTAGRPQGSENKEYVDVLHIPQYCSRCRSTNLKHLKRATTLDVPGVLPNGFAYEKVIWTRKVCADCGQNVMVRTYRPQRK